MQRSENKLSLAAALASALALGSLLSCQSSDKAGDQPPPLPVRTATVTTGTVSDLIDAAGALEPPPGLDVKLGPLVAGRLAQVLVAEGDRVRAGEVLARLDPAPLRDALAQAQAQASQAHAQEANASVRLVRAQQAFKAGVAARQEVDDARLADESARSAVAAAQAALSTARNQLGRSELRAPFEGVVAHVFAAAGEPVDANKPVLEVARIEKLELRAPLSPLVAARIHAGQAATVRADGVPGRGFPGTVVAVAPVVDPQSGTALVRILVSNADGLLRGGSFARARIVAQVKRDVLLVPTAALLSAASPDAGNASVEVVGADGKSKRTEVVIGIKDDQHAEVVSGLAASDRVIVSGNYALPDGTAVTEEAAPEQALKAGEQP